MKIRLQGQGSHYQKLRGGGLKSKSDGCNFIESVKKVKIPSDSQFFPLSASHLFFSLSFSTGKCISQTV
ncbi:hypothetical protein L1887_23504 [Cichorium endivia]|nr:hypothetical protein L1887_23504 [Cichorium endivia]